MHYTRQLIVAAVVVAACAIAAAAGAKQTAFPGKNGRIVFNDQNGFIDVVNANGTGVVRLAFTGDNNNYIGASWSPDGQLIAFSSSRGDPDVYTVRPDGSNLRQVTFSRGVDTDPTFSGDGSQIAFETNRNGNFDIYAVNADGSHPVQLTNSPLNDQDPAWSRQGKIAYTVESADKSQREIWVRSEGAHV